MALPPYTERVIPPSSLTGDRTPLSRGDNIANIYSIENIRNFVLSRRGQNVLSNAPTEKELTSKASGSWTSTDADVDTNSGLVALDVGHTFNALPYPALFFTGDNAGTETLKMWRIGQNPQNLKDVSAGSPFVSIAVYGGNAYCVNNGTTPFKFDLSTSPTVSNMGLTRPDVSIVGTQIAITSPQPADPQIKNVVRYYIAEISTDTEGPLSEAIETAGGDKGIDCGDGEGVTITLANNAEYHSKTYKVYRTYSNGGDAYYVGTWETTASGAQTYNDNTPDDALGDLPRLNGDPPLSTFKFIVQNYDRLWAITEGGRIYMSDLGAPESWSTDADIGNWLDVFPDDNDVVTGFGADETGLIVWKQNHMYRVKGRILSELEPKLITPEEGVSGLGLYRPQALSRGEGGYFFSFGDRIYYYKSGNLTDLSTSFKRFLKTPSGRSIQPWQNYALGYSSKEKLLFLSCNVSLVDITTDDPITFIIGLDAGGVVGRYVVGAPLSTVTPTQYTEYSAEIALGDSLGVAFTLAGELYFFTWGGDSEAHSASEAMEYWVELGPFYGNSPSIRKKLLWVEIDLAHNFEDETEVPPKVEIYVDNSSTAVSNTLSASQQFNYKKSRLFTTHRINVGTVMSKATLKILSDTSAVEAANNPLYNPAPTIYEIRLGWQDMTLSD